MGYANLLLSFFSEKTECRSSVPKGSPASLIGFSSSHGGVRSFLLGVVVSSGASLVSDPLQTEPVLALSGYGVFVVTGAVDDSDRGSVAAGSMRFGAGGL
ncbi:hypothetical protein ACOSP7_002655 [Xanthoceras sorbifolium]